MVNMSKTHQQAEVSGGIAAAEPIGGCSTIFLLLKRMARNDQVYARLKEANVPAAQCEGASVFADAVSQLDRRQSSVEMISNALKMFSTPLVTAGVLKEKPRVLATDERVTEIEFVWRASVNLDAFFKNCAPALDAAFSGAALAKTRKPAFVPVKESKDRGIACQMPSGSKIKFPEEVEYRSMAAIPLVRQKNKWGIVFYHLEQFVLEQLPKPGKEMTVVARFLDRAGSLLLEVFLTHLHFMRLQVEDCSSPGAGSHVTLAPRAIDFSFIPLLESAFRPVLSWSSPGRLAARDTVVASRKIGRSFWPLHQGDFRGSSIVDHRSRISFPTGLLSQIGKVDLIVEQAPGGGDWR